MKNIFFLCFCLATALSSAQETEKKSIQWGLSLGVETQYLGIELLTEPVEDDPWVFADRNKAGFTLGLVGQKHIFRELSFQTGLNCSFTRNLVTFYPPKDKVMYQFADLELPAYFVLTNHKSKNLPLRGKLLFGGRLGMNVGSSGDKRLLVLRERLALDLGLGVDIRFKKLSISPEAIYSHGMNNIHDFTSTEYDFLVGRVERDKLIFRVVLMRAK